MRRIIANVPAYAGFQPASVDLDAWRERWLLGLERDGILVGLNWTGARATGHDVEPAAAIARLVRVVGETGRQAD